MKLPNLPEILHTRLVSGILDAYLLYELTDRQVVCEALQRLSQTRMRLHLNPLDASYIAPDRIDSVRHELIRVRIRLSWVGSESDEVIQNLQWVCELKSAVHQYLLDEMDALTLGRELDRLVESKPSYALTPLLRFVRPTEALVTSCFIESYRLERIDLIYACLQTTELIRQYWSATLSDL